MKRILILIILATYFTVSAKNPKKKDWDYTFNKLDLLTIPIAGSMSYLGYINYYSRTVYSPSDIIATQNSKVLNYYRYSPALNDFATYYSIAIAGAGIAACGPLVGWNGKKIGTVAIMYAEMLMMERGLVGIIKNVTRNARPFVYDPTVPLSEKTARGKDAYMSFFSSKSSFAFANAFFWHDMIKHSDWDEKWRIYGTAFLYGSATAISAMNVVSGEHFTKDVLVGAIFGSTLAYTSLKLHDIYDMEPYYDLTKIRLVPTLNGVYASINF